MLSTKRNLTSAALASLALAMTLSVDSSAAEVATRATVAPTARIAPRPLPSGITAAEAARLRHQVQEHKQLKRMALADGEITRREQARLNYDAAQVRRLIAKAKNN